MKAAWFERFGPAREVLQTGDWPDPQPGAGEVRVRLRTSGVNPSDVKKRAGAIQDLLDEGPVIPNSDGAGVIDAVGTGVDDARVGERVWVYQAQFERRFGTAAEYVTLPSCRAVTLPDGTDFKVGACMGIPAMTAHRCVFADGGVDGRCVLVTGGAGRVGHYAIQFAAQAGARVIATASREEDAAACREAGARAVVNHREPDWARAVLRANGGEKIHRVIDVDFGGNLGQTLEVIGLSGTIVSYASATDPQPKLPFLRMMYLDLVVRLVIVYAMPEEAKQSAIRAITRGLAEGRLIHRVAHTLPLERIAEANELIEQGGVRGCVVVKTGS